MQTADAMGSIITDEDDEESMESEDEYGDEVPLDELVEQDFQMEPDQNMQAEISSTLGV